MCVLFWRATPLETSLLFFYFAELCLFPSSRTATSPLTLAAGDRHWQLCFRHADCNPANQKLRMQLVAQDANFHTLWGKVTRSSGLQEHSLGAAAGLCQDMCFVLRATPLVSKSSSFFYFAELCLFPLV